MTTRFDPRRDLIIVPSKVWGRGQYNDLALAVDTGSAATVLAPYVIEDIGYGPRDGLAVTTVRTAIGKEHGFTLKVARFAALGFVAANFEVHVFDLATGSDIDGLIGLSFLRHFDYEIRSMMGRIGARRASRDAAPA